MNEKKWADMTPKERSAHARSFIGKAKKATEEATKGTRKFGDAAGVAARVTAEFGVLAAKLTQEQRDAILRHPAINRPRKFG